MRRKYRIVRLKKEAGLPAIERFPAAFGARKAFANIDDLEKGEVAQLQRRSPRAKAWRLLEERVG